MMRNRSHHTILVIMAMAITVPAMARAQEKQPPAKEKFMGFLIDPNAPEAPHDPSCFEKSYTAINNIRKEYELPAIKYLEDHAAESSKKYIMNDEISCRISTLSMLRSQRSDAVEALLKYVEMRSQIDLDADSEYYYVRYPALYALINVGQPAVSILYGELCRRETSLYKSKLIIIAIIQIHFTDIQGGQWNEDGINPDLENAKARTFALFEGYDWRGISADRKEIITDFIRDYDLSTDLPEEIPGLIPLDIIEKMKAERSGEKIPEEF